MPERQAEREDEPREHRPAAHGAQPRIVEVSRDERGDAERKRNRHPDEACVERRRMNHHPVVLEQRVEPLAVCRHVRQERRERVLVDHHQIQEEHLNGRDGGDDVRDQLAVALSIHPDRTRSEDREQKHPEHDRAVEPAPVRRDLVEERLDAVRVVRDVADGKIVGQERVDHHRRCAGHQRGDEVEGTDAALNQLA